LDIFAATYGSERDFTTPPYNENCDFNLDGAVINSDLDAFAQRYGSEWLF
jgi:hypothetical protein